ncbi:MAG: hypothetical protein ACFFEF_02020 [Candidatus Thorarchaeota archaeon]
MDISMIGALFLASIITCWLGGELVRRRGIQLTRMTLILIHLVYAVSFVAAIVLL